MTLANAACFCANPACDLHLRATDVNVRGRGEWAELANGLMFSRTRMGEAMYCDKCVRAAIEGERVKQSGGIGHGNGTRQAV